MTTTDLGTAIPATASPRVEFISQIHPNPATELVPTRSRTVDVPYFRRYVRALEDAGFDYTLLPYGSSAADSFILAAAVGQLTERLKPIVALRPNTVFPLVAAQQLATLDQLTEGRAVVHLISGGNDAEQARQGDYLPKDRRYARTAEYLDLLRRAWTEREPFSHHGEFYTFDDFGPGLATYTGAPLPISIGGQSDPAFEIGGRQADIFSFWGEPLDAITTQIARVTRIAADAGRTSVPRFWVTFRPIIAPTDELAWEKARGYVERIGITYREGSYFRKGLAGPGERPQNVGSQRALEFAGRQEIYDRALWTRTASATNGQGAATALVGSPETVAAAILDYIDLGASLVSIRGYDNLNDLIDYGRYVLPLVRSELTHRASTGQRGSLQATHRGALA
ncbi:LLM class flavin-dependent oxidoreductase [Saccharomonospora sp. NPDC046836]|uniref:LLM class flavin-dependent oxidoreductase n=1 Tax=Saccharomonospora sp. NPDC046836 TaxID=3156921 RepID=UPI00340084C2